MFGFKFVCRFGFRLRFNGRHRLFFGLGGRGDGLGLGGGSRFHLLHNRNLRLILKLSEGILATTMVVGLHLFKKGLAAIAGINHHSLGHLEAIAVTHLGDSAQPFQAVFAGEFQFVLECIEVVAPHLACHLFTHTIALGYNFHYAVVACGSLAIHDVAGSRIVDTRHRVVVRRLLHTIKRTDLGQFHFLPFLQQLSN